MPRLLAFVLAIVLVLWLSARRSALGKMSFENGLLRKSSSKLGALGFEVEDVMRRIAFSGTLEFRNSGGRIVFSSRPRIDADRAQGLVNLLSQFVVRGGRVMPRGGPTRRGGL